MKSPERFIENWMAPSIPVASGSWAHRLSKVVPGGSPAGPSTEAG